MDDLGHRNSDVGLLRGTAENPTDILLRGHWATRQNFFPNVRCLDAPWFRPSPRLAVLARCPRVSAAYTPCRCVARHDDASPLLFCSPRPSLPPCRCLPIFFQETEISRYRTMFKFDYMYVLSWAP